MFANQLNLYSSVVLLLRIVTTVVNCATSTNFDKSSRVLVPNVSVFAPNRLNDQTNKQTNKKNSCAVYEWINPSDWLRQFNNQTTLQIHIFLLPKFQVKKVHEWSEIFYWSDHLVLTMLNHLLRHHVIFLCQKCFKNNLFCVRFMTKIE